MNKKLELINELMETGEEFHGCGISRLSLLFRFKNYELQIKDDEDEWHSTLTGFNSLFGNEITRLNPTKDPKQTNNETAEKLRFLAEKAETGEEFLASIRKARFKDSVYEEFIDGEWIECDLIYSGAFSDIPWVPKDVETVWKWEEIGKKAVCLIFNSNYAYHLWGFLQGAFYRTQSEAEQKGPKRYEELLAEYNKRLNND